MANRAGLAAEDGIARRYAAEGHEVIARRYRTATGELDLVVRDGAVLVFVEVKRRKRALPDSPVPSAQWKRLACAAQEFMIENPDMTRTAPLCRFDVAIVGPDGRAEIIKNARMFD